MAVLIVEDDFFYGTQLAEMLQDHGAATVRALTAEDALSVPHDQFDSAIIDVMLPNDSAVSGISAEESRGGFLTGVALARRLRKDRPELKLVFITGEASASESDRWARDNGVPIVMKSEGRNGVRRVLQNVGIIGKRPGPKAFIVHGHDEGALLQLKNFLQNTLRWPEPVVLREQANSGKTIIEKFEEFTDSVDCVFVLLTPDDPTMLDGAERRCSRQNVIFELGFFYAQFGRLSGRVIVLHKGPNELPSDISGICWIGIDRGVEAAGEEIRRELLNLIGERRERP